MATRTTSTGTAYSASSSTTNFSTKTTSSKKRPPVFPKRLYDMLEDADRGGYSHIISWMPDGESFKIHVDGSVDEEDEKAIVEILKRTFNQTRFKSFLRQLQLYGFERIYKGPRRGECRHKLLVRGQRDLLHKKSIEDFQREASCGGRSPNKSARKIYHVSPTPSEVTSFMKKTESRIQASDFPFCPPLTSSSSEGSKCSYFQNSVIPTRLVNLVLPESDSSVRSASSCDHNNNENDDEISLTMECPLLDREVQIVADDDLVSINSDDQGVFDWTGVELEILRGAIAL